MFSFYLYVYALASAIFQNSDHATIESPRIKFSSFGLRHMILKKSEASRLVIDNLGRVPIPELHAMPVHVECQFANCPPPAGRPQQFRNPVSLQFPGTFDKYSISGCNTVSSDTMAMRICQSAGHANSFHEKAGRCQHAVLPSSSMSLFPFS
jgi:hypothetical protein